jgi:hypothetical protein
LLAESAMKHQLRYTAMTCCVVSYQVPGT